MGDDLDVYSNVLYVQEARAELSRLAHAATRCEKYRPETCCVVGNYYSLKAQHERAVLYFRRALRLDRTCLSAWTLMGHEYIEMKNTAGPSRLIGEQWTSMAGITARGTVWGKLMKI